MFDQDWDTLGKCKEHTGYKKQTLRTIYECYCGPSTPIKNHKDLLRCYKFIHRYNRWSQSSFDLQCSTWYLSSNILPQLHYLATTLNEIHWEDRLSLYNHCPHFPTKVTLFVDTSPLEILQPSSEIPRQILYNGKYAIPCYKMQMGIDFLGRIDLFTGPHLGTTYDAHIWQFTSERHPVESWEYLLGDGHYSCIPDFITPPKQPAYGHLSDDEYFLSSMIGHYRARVEHINNTFKTHQAFQSPFRGSLDLLSDMMHVTAHTLNIELHKYLRYPPYGPWRHDI